MRLFGYILLASVFLAGLSSRAESPRFLQTLQAAQRGDAGAQFMLGTFYYYGREEVKQDYTQAAVWYCRAAEQGNVRAQIALGLCYWRGEGVPKNYWKGTKLLVLPNGGLPKKETR